jgi:hypothetical protein
MRPTYTEKDGQYYEKIWDSIILLLLEVLF